MRREEETHDQLMKAFQQYFKANQNWINKGTRRAGMDTRYWLSEIRRLCSDRRDNIMTWRRWLNEETEQKKAQKDSGKDDDTAN
jgi:hypothetical protein